MKFWEEHRIPGRYMRALIHASQPTLNPETRVDRFLQYR
jgi:hypothetical protein